MTIINICFFISKLTVYATFIMEKYGDRYKIIFIYRILWGWRPSSDRTRREP